MAFDNSVFINCPFDQDYINNLLKPMAYVIIKNGFIPRLSLEVSDSGQIRLEKITGIIKSCKYGIHDLSIVKSRKAKEYRTNGRAKRSRFISKTLRSSCFMISQILIPRCLKKKRVR